MTFSIVEIEDPEVASPTIIHTYNPTIEPDGSLNLSKISWVKKGDIYVCCTSIRGIYTNLIHPSLSPIIPAEKWTPLLRIHNGTAVLLLIRADRVKTSQVHDSSDVPGEPSDFPETLIVVRQIRDFDEEEHCIVRNWTVALESDLSLDPSKLGSIKPGEVYLGRKHDGFFEWLIYDECPPIDYGMLDLCISEIQGIAQPVLLIISRPDYHAMKRRRDEKRGWLEACTEPEHERTG
ncbi:hypothetical protein H2248_001531 [Termitomyces sp. 'cryptogamus']|nr:hypothetical protein H2248_001531 [Termitomyces sp. 'cryptogamus']